MRRRPWTVTGDRANGLIPEGGKARRITRDEDLADTAGAPHESSNLGAAATDDSCSVTQEGTFVRKIVNSTYVTLDGVITDPQDWPSMGGFSDAGTVGADAAAGALRRHPARAARPTRPSRRSGRPGPATR